MSRYERVRSAQFAFSPAGPLLCGIANSERDDKNGARIKRERGGIALARTRVALSHAIAMPTRFIELIARDGGLSKSLLISDPSNGQSLSLGNEILRRATVAKSSSKNLA